MPSHLRLAFTASLAALVACGGSTVASTSTDSGTDGVTADTITDSIGAGDTHETGPDPAAVVAACATYASARCLKIQSCEPSA
ncbi:MAG: hypothetical protein ACHREM_17555, partial [Polyangiales bacterium]